MSRLRLTIACLLGLLWSVLSLTVLFAQQEDGGWIEPVNLSQSGATVSPVTAMDNTGSLHVLWQDSYLESYVYQYQDGDEWSTAITVTLPFSLSVPRLIIDDANQMHAFWQYGDGEDDQTVSYSSVPVTAVADPTAWSPLRALTGDVADYDVALDDGDGLHLLYLQPDETVNAASGIYHMRTIVDDAGTPGWSAPTLLYASSYLRDLNETNANVELATAVSGDKSWLLAAWDNRSRKQIFFSRSGDGGSAWEAPIEIVGPESGSSSVIPFNVAIGVKNDNVVLVWNKGQQDVGCQQFSVSSPDLGVSWDERLPMDDLLPGTPSCVSENEFVVGTELMLLLSTVQNQQFMWAWDGQHWSPPAAQPILTSFDNPETLNAVVFRCQQRVTTADDRLLVVGCEEDIRTFGDGDIWLLSRPLGSASDWFPPPTVWKPFDQVSSEPDTYHSMILAPGANGEMLAFWTPTENPQTDQLSIVNARMAEDRWLLPEIVLTVPRASIGSPLAAVTNLAGQLYLTWTDDTGQLYLAQTAVPNAHIASLWSQVTEVSLEYGVSYPTLAADDNNVLYLAYTVAVNEGRGVYLLTSEDGGQVWSEPILVFDGVAAGWDVVGPAALAVTGDGRINLQWEQRSLFSHGAPQTQALYYASSNDAGQTFTSAVMIIEGAITWNQLVATGQQELHRFWQMTEDEAMILFHTHSENGGQTWSQPALVSTAPGSAAVAANEDSVFLLMLTDTAVQEWHWQDGKWAQLTGFPITDVQVVAAPEQTIAATLSSNGLLATLFVGQTPDEAQEAVLQDNLYTSSRVVELAAGETAVEPSVPVTAVETETEPVAAPALPTVAAEPTLAIGVAATPKPSIPADLNAAAAVPTVSGTAALLVGFLPAVLLVLIVFGIAIWRMRRRPAKE